MKEQRINNRKELLIEAEKKELIDGLLDIYNDYKNLYELFQDEYYKKMMELILRNLGKINC